MTGFSPHSAPTPIIAPIYLWGENMGRGGVAHPEVTPALNYLFLTLSLPHQNAVGGRWCHARARTALMIALARNILRRFGFVGILLLTLAAAVPATAQACVPLDQSAVATASAVNTAPADSDDCGDCGLVCFHGCCHGTHAAIPAFDAAPLALIRFQPTKSWTHAAGNLPASPAGLERPPRT